MARAWLVVVLALSIAGFDHIDHERKIDVKGIAEIACTKCHVETKGKLVGKPGHAACFGQCHGAAPVAPKRGAKLVVGDNAKLCSSCHAEAVLQRAYTGKLPARYPPYVDEQDFGIAFGHKQHAASACAQCHNVRDIGKSTKPAPHQRCVGCHDGSGAQGHAAAMKNCVSCHPRAVGKPQPPELATVRDSVTSTFSHGKHAARGATGRDCATCHAAIRATDDIELPRPKQQDCEAGGCHDGKAAFATTNACTRCHDKVPDRFEVFRPTTRFTFRLVIG